MNNGICPNCNNVNAPGAKFCAKCGTALGDSNVQQGVPSTGGTGHLIIERKDSFWGCAVPVTIGIGGYSYQLQNGGKIEMDLNPGTYQVTYKVWSRSLKTVDVVITPSCMCRVYLVPDLLLGGFKLSKESKLQ